MKTIFRVTTNPEDGEGETIGYAMSMDMAEAICISVDELAPELDCVIEEVHVATQFSDVPSIIGTMMTEMSIGEVEDEEDQKVVFDLNTGEVLSKEKIIGQDFENALDTFRKAANA